MSLAELLKAQGLTEEQITAITKAMGENKIYTTSLENADERYNKLKGQKEDAEKQLKTANDTISDLKKNNGDNETLQKTIKDHENTINTLKKEAENTVKAFALKEQLSKAGVLDPDYLIYKQGGLDKFNFDKEGKPIGVEDIVKPFKEDKGMTHLFQATKQDYNPAGGTGGNTVNPFAKETYNLTEQGKLLRDNPAQAKELAAAAGVTI
ncbi:MAG TPA: phage scaffolding protein [Lachnospiraceae bacterium]|nr:phage scaffolding protein [Lachnospiraceae bacterium]